jgi:antitoxin component of MazEF toxin-antitoxin module
MTVNRNSRAATRKILAKRQVCSYIVIMKTRIIQIGNSRGVRIPKTLLEQSGLGEEVELKVDKEQIIIRPVKKARESWPTISYRTKT